MEITGRLVKDAQVRKVKDNREVVNFTIVMNDRFATKAGEAKEVATFVDCSYWMSSKVAKVLSKGNVVTVSGRIGVQAYTNAKGEVKATLTMHTNEIKVQAFYQPKQRTVDNLAPREQAGDGLPF